MVTVTHEVRPIVLFQDAGPFKMQFVTARTIVNEGMPMERVFDTDMLPADSPTLVFHHDDDPDTCAGYFAWSEVTDALAYHLIQTVPISEAQTIADPVGLRFPTESSEPNTMVVKNYQEYRIAASNLYGDGPFSNIVAIGGCGTTLTAPQNLVFTLEHEEPCDGTLSWEAVTDAVGYHIYEATAGLVGGDVLSPTTNSGTINVSNGGLYTVKAYDAVTDGPPSTAVSISGCTLSDPVNLAFRLYQGTPPCQGYLTWDSVAGAAGYHVYDELGNPLFYSSVSRYPATAGSNMTVIEGFEYQVSAYDSSMAESNLSNLVTVSGCFLNEGEVDVTYWLHSNPSPPNWHGDAPAPLVMNEVSPRDPHTPPYHDVLYDYNNPGGQYPGRQILKGGLTPLDDEEDLTDYLAWYSTVQLEPLTLITDVELILWGKHPENVSVTGAVYLYEYDPDADADPDADPNDVWRELGSATNEWGANTDDWTKITYTFVGSAGEVVHKDNQLVVWKVASVPKQLHFAYDTISYDSRIEFTGQWVP